MISHTTLFRLISQLLVQNKLEIEFDRMSIFFESQGQYQPKIPRLDVCMLFVSWINGGKKNCLSSAWILTSRYKSVVDDWIRLNAHPMLQMWWNSPRWIVTLFFNRGSMKLNPECFWRARKEHEGKELCQRNTDIFFWSFFLLPSKNPNAHPINFFTCENCFRRWNAFLLEATRSFHQTQRCCVDKVVHVVAPRVFYHQSRGVRCWLSSLPIESTTWPLGELIPILGQSTFSTHVQGFAPSLSPLWLHVLPVHCYCCHPLTLLQGQFQCQTLWSVYDQQHAWEPDCRLCVTPKTEPSKSSSGNTRCNRLSAPCRLSFQNKIGVHRSSGSPRGARWPQSSPTIANAPSGGGCQMWRSRTARPATQVAHHDLYGSWRGKCSNLSFSEGPAGTAWRRTAGISAASSSISSPASLLAPASRSPALSAKGHRRPSFGLTGFDPAGWNPTCLSHATARHTLCSFWPKGFSLHISWSPDDSNLCQQCYRRQPWCLAQPSGSVTSMCEI